MKKEEMIYLTVEKIVEYNFLALSLIKVKKADQPKVLNQARLFDIVKGCKEMEGDVYDKAMFLFKNLIKQHPFASGNRRTAFISTKAFLLENKQNFNIRSDPEQAKIMLGIREGYYTDEEIKEWIKHGKIKPFKRS